MATDPQPHRGRPCVHATATPAAPVGPEDEDRRVRPGERRPPGTMP